MRVLVLLPSSFAFLLTMEVREEAQASWFEFLSQRKINSRQVSQLKSRRKERESERENKARKKVGRKKAGREREIEGEGARLNDATKRENTANHLFPYSSPHDFPSRYRKRGREKGREK